MAVDKPSASNQLPSSDMNSNTPTLPAGFAYNAQNWLVMQSAGQDSRVADNVIDKDLLRQIISSVLYDDDYPESVKLAIFEAIEAAKDY